MEEQFRTLVTFSRNCSSERGQMSLSGWGISRELVPSSTIRSTIVEMPTHRFILHAPCLGVGADVFLQCAHSGRVEVFIFRTQLKTLLTRNFIFKNQSFNRLYIWFCIYVLIYHLVFCFLYYTYRYIYLLSAGMKRKSFSRKSNN